MLLRIRKTMKQLKKTFLRVFYLLYSMMLSFFVKRDPKYIAIGSWEGKLYIDNSRYLLEFMLEKLDSSYRFVWVGESYLKKQLPEDDRIILVCKDTMSSVRILQRCKYFFSSQIAYVDICSYNIYRNAIMIYLHHGFPIKKVEADAVGFNKKDLSLAQKIYRKVVPYGHEYDYFIVSSDVQKKNYISAYRFMGAKADGSNILCVGTPRNDFLYNLTEEDKKTIRKKYEQLLGINEETKIILYLPTFRRKGNETPSLYLGNENSEIINILEKNNAILIEKGHFAEQSERASNDTQIYYKNYIHLTKAVNVQELLVAADILISDYSGAFVDYILLDRPIIHYLYDYEYYKKEDSGLYFEVDEFKCGKICFDYKTLCDGLKSLLETEDDFKKIRAERRETFLTYESGESCKKIVEEIIFR